MKTIEQLTQELEAVKKERAWFKEQFDMLRNSYSIMVPQRDEAVRYLKRWLRGENRKQLQSEIEGFLSRLSSGETKVEFIECPDCVAVNRLPKWDYCGLECCCPTCLGKGEIEKISPSNTSSSSQETNQPEIQGSSTCKHLHVSGTVCTDCGELTNPSEKPNSSPIPPLHPGSWTFPLFHHIISEHDKILTDSECMEIVEIVRRMDAASPASPWISVEDRLPEVHKEYDIALNNGKTGIGIYHTDKVWIAKGYSWDFLKSKERVTHFMERLPAPQESLTDKK